MDLKLFYTWWKTDYRPIITDTRQITKNCVFFALKGPNFDGNSFAAKALELGASKVVVDNEQVVNGPNFILVPDVLSFLQALAAYHRTQLAVQIIGITGSNGKTTTKELVFKVLSAHFVTHATIGNLNNHIGVPLTLLQLKPEHQFAVIEIGANKPGEVEMLCNWVKPNFGICTTIGKEHLEGFDNLDTIIANETALYASVKMQNGMIFAHYDNEILQKEAAKYPFVFWYGTTEKADLIGKYKINEMLIQFAWELSPKLLYRAPYTQTNLTGSYNFANILAAVTVGRYLSVPYDTINKAIKNYIPSNNRSQIIQKYNKTIILDAYNANPHSMEAAINNLIEIQGYKKMAVLGDMFELGKATAFEHKHLVNILQDANIEKIILVGSHFENVMPLDNPKFIHFKNIETLKNAWQSLLSFADLILIKGSRGMALEKIIQ